MAPKTKMFGGKRYTNQGGTTRKDLATSTVKKFRKAGQSARVFHDAKEKTYYVYAR